jgi:thioredoxin 1
MRVGMLDSDANPQITQQHGVMGLPTLILFVGGVAVERIVGFTPRERIEAKILPHLAVEKA